MAQETKQFRPVCEATLKGENIFAILGVARRALRQCGLNERAVEMTNRVTQSGSYDEAVRIISEYVETK